jgi:general bacterial porin, GBP family
MPRPFNRASRVFFCLVTLAASGSQASAQSIVSMYGQIDTGVAYLSNVAGSSHFLQTSGFVEGSYFGLIGSEPLGGDLRAIFRLERGFDTSNGALLNDHPTFVGLDSTTYGRLTLGYQYDLIHDYFTPFTLTDTAGGSAFAPPFDNDNESGTWLAANSVKYASPEVGGFRFSGMYGFSNSTDFAKNRSYGVGAAYGIGGFNAAATWLHYNGGDPAEASPGTFATVTLPGANGDVFGATVQRYDTIGTGVSYTIGAVTICGAWSRSIFTGIVDTDSNTAAPSIAFSNYEVNASWQINPAFVLAGMYNYTHATSFGHWNMGAVSAEYLLSKRTDLYLETVYIRASSGVAAVTYGNAPSDNRNQLLVAAGIRHRF